MLKYVCKVIVRSMFLKKLLMDTRKTANAFIHPFIHSSPLNGVINVLHVLYQRAIGKGKYMPALR